MDFYAELHRIMGYDAGNRGLRGPVPDLPGLGASLAAASRVLILTGFPVLRPDRSAVGETDGPVGAAELARALELLGCRVSVATDAPSYPLVRAALAAVSSGGEAVLIPGRGTAAFAASLTEALRPSHLIALERPGKGAGGHFHSMRGRVIDGAVADTDCFFANARRQGIVTVGIGDGGNELGMGALRRQVACGVPHGPEIAAREPADYTLTAGVSNWWGAGLAALLSYETGKALMLSGEAEAETLRAVVAAGGLDGCTGRHTLTVDSLPLAVHLERRAALEQLLEACRREPEQAL